MFQTSAENRPRGMAMLRRCNPGSQASKHPATPSDKKCRPLVEFSRHQAKGWEKIVLLQRRVPHSATTSGVEAGNAIAPAPRTAGAVGE